MHTYATCALASCYALRRALSCAVSTLHCSAVASISGDMHVLNWTSCDSNVVKSLHSLRTAPASRVTKSWAKSEPLTADVMASVAYSKKCIMIGITYQQ